MAGAIRSDVPREDPWNEEKRVHRITPWNEEKKGQRLRATASYKRTRVRHGQVLMAGARYVENLLTDCVSWYRRFSMVERK
jgi:hypothetical protein